MGRILVYGRKLLDYFDRLSDGLTTYRSILYLLIIYVAAALVLSLDGKVAFPASHILLSTVWLLVICRSSNSLISKLLKIPASHDADLITALILSLILTPASNGHDYAVLAAAAFAAMASKYILTFRGQHIFNPAALGATISGLAFGAYASWWISGSHTVLLLLLGGLLIARKMHRFQMVLLFIAIDIAYILLFLHLNLSQPGGSHRLYLNIAATPLLFLSTIMLTEPLTSPFKFRNSLIYAAVAGVFYSVTSLGVTPEEALLIANVAAFVLEPNRGLLLKFVERRLEAAGVYSYLFRPAKKLNFAAGQYMEWTVPGVGLDGRGNRRYLTISSSPTEQTLMFTARVNPHKSKFKDKLERLKKDEVIAANRLEGNFVLPKNRSQKLAFIAGGVGITPFRSMTKYLIDKNEARDIILLYGANTADELAFKSLFAAAGSVGLRAHYVLALERQTGYLNGYIDKNVLTDKIKDYHHRHFYISGPQGFVAAVRAHLLQMGVPGGRITTDYFPGYN